MTWHIAELAFLRGLIWMVAFYFAIRFRSRLTIIAVLVAWVGNVLLANGLLIESGLVGVAQVSLVVYLLVDRLAHRPDHIERVVLTQLHDARRDLHDSRSDARSWEARAVAYQRILEKHGITH